MASSIVKSAAQQLGSLLVEEGKYLYGVRPEIESLQMELEWIQCFLKDADTQQHQDEVICKWVSQVRDFAYDGEDIIERFLHEVSHHQRDGIWNTLKWVSCIICTGDAMRLHNLGSDLDYLTSRMSELTSRLQRYGVQLIKPIRSLEYDREEWRTYSHTEEDVVGLKEDIQKVVDQLLKTDVKVVAISGTGGLGKSTLARKVYKHKDIKNHFNHICAWVYISKEFDKKTIFQEILLGLEKDEEVRKRIKEKLKVEELAGEINKLLQERRCLVVVDDIWTETARKNLKPAFESVFTTASSSSKILLTTRNQRLLQHVDPSGYLHLLLPLSPDDSWELLKRKALFIGHESTGGESSTNGQNKTNQNEPQDDAQVKHECDSMEEVGRKMLKHCDGLPIAIVALGGILSTKTTISEWKDVEKNISSYLMDGTEEGGGEDDKSILKVLELSYHDLPFYLKPCFLYLGNFPEDYKISTQRLYHLWEAEGFLAIKGKSKKKRETSYDIGERYLNELVQRSMVQAGEFGPSRRIKTCQVHDVMRDMCLRKCEEVSFLHYMECTGSDVASAPPAASNEIKILRRCALYDEKGDFLHTHFEKGERVVGLRSLLVFHRMKKGTLQKICKEFPVLRVLDLEYTGIDGIDGVGHLIHLRYLRLRGVTVGPSCLYDLKYLETLDLRGFKSFTIKICNEFHKMKRLRHLYLPRAFKVKGDKKLTFPTSGQMETIKNFDLERCETKELMQMTNLSVFSIRRYCSFKKVEELKWVLDAPVMKKVGQLINSLRLEIVWDVIKEDPAILSSVAHHPCLNELKVLGMKDRNINEGNADDGAAMEITTTNNNTGGIIFPDGLTVVDLWNCEIGEGDVLALEKLPHLKVFYLRGKSNVAPNKLSFSPWSFLKLTQLDLLGNDRVLKELEVGEGALPNLQQLQLTGCTKVKNIPESLTQVWLRQCQIGAQDGNFFLALEKLPHLQQLSIGELIIITGSGGGNNKLSFSPGSFPQLVELDLRCPPELGEWEIGDGALPNLQLLTLMGCKKLNNFPNSLTRVHLKYCKIGEAAGGVLLLALENLPCLQQLDLWYPVIGGGGNKMRFSPRSFPQLRQLEIWNPKELEQWEVGDGALPTLQHLELIGCEKLKKLPEGLPDSVDIECKYPCIKGIEKYNTCPDFKESRWRLKPMWWLHDSYA